MPELVAPIMPDIAGSFRPLARGIAQWAENRRYAQQLELQYQKQAQDAANDNAMMDLRRQQLANQFSVQQSQIDLNKAHAGYYKNYQRAVGGLAGLAAKQREEYNVGVLDVVKDARERYGDEYHINDPKFQTQDPIAWASNVVKWGQEFYDAPRDAGLKPIIDKKLAEVKSMTTPTHWGATYNEDLEKWEGGQWKQQSLYEIAKNLHTPELREQQLNALKGAGYFERVSGGKHQEPSQEFWGGTVQRWLGKKGKQVEVKEPLIEMPKDYVQKWIESAGQTDFTPQQSRVPQFMAPTSGAYKGTGELRQQYEQELKKAPTPAQDFGTSGEESSDGSSAAPASATPFDRFDETPTDQILNQARAAVQAGAPLQAIAQRLAAQHIDPNLLFQERALQGLQKPIMAPGARFNQTGVA